MSIFLFLKQIVDMLYPYKWLDYAMVIMAGVAIIYQFLLVRPKLRTCIQVTDVCVLVISVLYLLHFGVDLVGVVLHPEAGNAFRYGVYVKPLSAALVYFLGRLYYERILECGAALAFSSYLVVYANFIARLVVNWGQVFQVTNAGGDLYYYDTDMAYAMLTAFVFIIMYGRNNILKLITILFTIPYMVICSDAGIQKIMLIVMAVLIMLYLLEKIGVPGKVSNVILITSVAGLLLVIAGLVFPSVTGGQTAFFANASSGRWLSVDNLTGSYASWHKGWQTIHHAPWIEKLTGIFDSGASYGNLYVRLLYSLGYMGCICFVLIIIAGVMRATKMTDRKTCYIALMLGILFLGTGVTTRCMEFTQMSWFVMMFLGMTVSSVQNKEEAEKENNRAGNPEV